MEAAKGIQRQLLITRVLHPLFRKCVLTLGLRRRQRRQCRIGLEYIDTTLCLHHAPRARPLLALRREQPRCSILAGRRAEFHLTNVKTTVKQFLYNVLKNNSIKLVNIKQLILIKFYFL